MSNLEPEVAFRFRHTFFYGKPRPVANVFLRARHPVASMTGLHSAARRPSFTNGPPIVFFSYPRRPRAGNAPTRTNRTKRKHSKKSSLGSGRRSAPSGRRDIRDNCWGRRISADPALEHYYSRLGRWCRPGGASSKARSRSPVKAWTRARVYPRLPSRLTCSRKPSRTVNGFVQLSAQKTTRLRRRSAVRFANSAYAYGYNFGGFAASRRSAAKRGSPRRGSHTGEKRSSP